MKILNLFVVLFSLCLVYDTLAQYNNTLCNPDDSACVTCAGESTSGDLCSNCLAIPNCMYCISEYAQGCISNTQTYTTKCKTLPTPGTIYSASNPCPSTDCTTLGESCSQCTNNFNCGYCITSGTCMNLGSGITHTNFVASAFTGCGNSVPSFNVYNCLGVCNARSICGACLGSKDSSNDQPCVYCPTANGTVCYDQNNLAPQCATNSTTNSNQCPPTGSASTLSGIIFAIVAAIFISTLKNFP